MKPVCKLIGQNGNVFNLIGITRKTLKDHGLQQELDQFDQRFNEIKDNSGSYYDVLNLIAEFVTVE
ncbi:MAG: hypothetical protein EOM59_12355 [Clostridia bacterium]|nr:hypothetical protein [Clostridia bacterium]